MKVAAVSTVLTAESDTDKTALVDSVLSLKINGIKKHITEKKEAVMNNMLLVFLLTKCPRLLAMFLICKAIVVYD